MSSRVTTSAGAGGGVSRSSQSTSQRRHRSRSTSRYADLDKPKKKKTLSATTSLVSIPNTIKLSMLNSGLLSFEKVKLEARDENNSLSQTIPDKPIELRHFVKLCEQRRKFPVLYKLEFQTAVKVETNTCRHATRKNNLEKNQNQKCIPYDYNRVVLEKIPGIPDSDYVNASYVDSLLKPNAYIVTQGPTEETVNEFWRMIWQENVSAIVMLTKTFDFTKVMCVQYWPPNCEVHETYGDININIVKEEQLANFQIRTFRLYKKNAEGHVIEERLILQFHYTEWHSHTCPFSNAVLEFRRRVRAVVGNIIKPNSMVGPILVHCNDGGGRSGVYLAIDANLELAEEEDCFHVFGYLKKLRQSRKGLIENVDQYKFVYDTLEEHIVCGKTWFPVTELSEKLKMKAKKDTVTKMNEYQREYAQICKQTPRFTIGDCAGGHRADNREKNRDVLCVPPDNFRPYLTSFQGNAFTDYINSVFVDGYTKPREYIVTEWPLKHTLGEFWSLVYDHECSAVVVLCQPPPNSQQFPSFWPQKSKMEKYGPVFSVHFVSGKHYQNIKQWEYRINKKIISLTEMMAGVKAPTKTVQLFQLTCWPMGHKVPTSTNSLVFLMNMVELWRQRQDYGPVCVVSPDGRSRAGVYCAANACIEQVIQHGEVDVFQAVKTVRRHRPQLIDNMTEYKYCYDLVLHYVLHFLDKDHKEKKFIAFGRGKCIPLTPDSLNAELPSEISNTGRIVVNKCIDKIDKRELLHEKDIFNQNHLLDRAAKISERKKKGRLYSLGGNEPQRKGHRGRLDRLKTVGTFDLGTEMSVLSEVARNLNEKLITGELGVLHSLILPPDDTRRPSMTPSNLSSMHNTSVRNTPESRKRDLNRSTSSFKPEYHRVHLKSPLLQAKNGGEFKPQHSADDCVQRSVLTPTSAKKSRSLSTSSYLNKEKLEQAINYSQTSETRNYIPPITQTSTITMNTDSSITEKNESPIFQRCDQRVLTKQTSEMLNLPEKIESEKLQDDITSHEDTRKNTEFSYRTRKSMLRKSRRIVRTDSEIFKEGIIGEKNEIILVQNADIQIHANPDSDKTREVPSDSCRNSSVTSSSMQSRKDSSDFDDICSPREPQKSTDESSKNISTDDMDAVFSDSNTDLEKLEKEYKELIKSNLQREYKSDGDTLDEIGKKRNDFGKWKNQSLEHEFEFSNQELMNIVGGDQTLSSYSYGTSTDMKDMSRICSPESCTNGAYSDSGVKGLDDKYMSYSKIRSRVYSSSRLGETPTERERLHPININDHDSYISSMQMQAVSDDQTLDRSTTTKSTLIRPSILEININNDNRSKTENPTAGSTNTEGTITSLFEKRFGKFKKVNKLLKCKRFSTSTLYEKKKTSTTDDTKGPNRIINKLSGKLHHTNTKQSSSNLLEAKSLFSSSKLSLFSQKPGKSSIFSSKKSSMFSSASSHSNNELFSHTSSKTKLSEVSKSNTELSKYRTSPSRFNSKKSSKTGKTNSSACLNSNICHSPLSEEFYNKTGSVRLSAMELYEKFCSEDFGGLYKHETFKNDERHDGFANQHEYRLEKKGLRAIGRYHKNARLLKQKSEPKFNFRPSAGGGEVAYYHEEDEYYYNRKPQEPYEYYNEQDEYYDEYDDEYDEDGEGDYYEDEEGDYYEDDVEFDEHANINDSNIQVITDDECGAVCLPHHLHSTKEENEAGTSADSDVDEIFLMPEGSKCSDYDEYGFENKHFSLEHSMLVHTNGKNISLNYLNSIEQDDLSSDTEVVTEIRKSYEKYPDDDVLTIYKICSREDVCKVTSDVEVIHEPSSHRSSSLQCESLEQAVNEYMKNALEPSITRTDCITSSIDRTDSLELLSNSSGTIRSRSTFTEYAFDTVKNLNLDSCSTSKLSLSLKSEVFDDFTITPDDIKPIQNCEFEDFTLTPEGSVCEGGSGSGGATISGEVAAQSMKNPTTTTTTEKEAERDESKSPLDDEYQNKVVIIVDKFLANERNLRQSSYTDEEADQNSDVIDDIGKEDNDKGETVKQEQTENDQCTTTYFQETQENTDVADDENKSLDSSSDKDLIGTGNELTVVDLYDEDEHTISLFTSELTKEFDRLFSRAEKSQYGGETSFEHHSSSSDIMDNEEDLLRRSSKIPSRQSMQKLEPYFIADPPEDNCTSNKDLDKDLMSTSLKNSEYTKVFGVRDNLAATAAAARRRTITSITLKNARSQSLGNLNKKTKCFPL